MANLLLGIGNPGYQILFHSVLATHLYFHHFDRNISLGRPRRLLACVSILRYFLAKERDCYITSIFITDVKHAASAYEAR